MKYSSRIEHKRKLFEYSPLKFIVIALAILLLVNAYWIFGNYLFAATGSTTGIRYEFVTAKNSRLAIRDATATIASRNGLVSYSSSGLPENERTTWKKNVPWLFPASGSVYLVIGSYSPTDAVNGMLTGYISIHTIDKVENYDWQKIAKQVELAITPLVKFTTVNIGLNPAVYGACTSDERPTIADTYCSIPVNPPINFYEFTRDELEPRAHKHQLAATSKSLK